MRLKEIENDRGLTIYEFKDIYNSKCQLQDSSTACINCIWLGVHTDFEGRDCTAMHLMQEQVKTLLPYLKAFVKKGELPTKKEK